MKRTICLIIMLCIFSSLFTCYATNQSYFYYDQKAPDVNAALFSEESQKQMRFVAEVWLQENMPEKAPIDPAKITFRYDEILQYHPLWNDMILKEFLEAEDRGAYLQKYRAEHPGRVVFDLPCYYDGERVAIFMRIQYDPDTKQYKYLKNFYVHLSMEVLQETTIYVNQQRVSEFLASKGYEGWTPILPVNIYSCIFYVVQKGDQEGIYCLGGKVFEKNNPEISAAITGKLLSTDEMIQQLVLARQASAERVAEQKRNGTYGNSRETTVSPSDSGTDVAIPSSTDSVTSGEKSVGALEEEQGTPPNYFLWWMIGGAVVLAGIAVTIALILAKKKA